MTSLNGQSATNLLDVNDSDTPSNASQSSRKYLIILNYSLNQDINTVYFSVCTLQFPKMKLFHRHCLVPLWPAQIARQDTVSLNSFSSGFLNLTETNFTDGKSLRRLSKRNDNHECGTTPPKLRKVCLHCQFDLYLTLKARRFLDCRWGSRFGQQHE